MQKYKTPIIFIGIILVLAIAYFVLNGVDDKKPSNDSNTANKEEIFKINTDDIKEITVTNDSGEYTFIYGDTVTVKNNNGITISENGIKAFATEFTSINIDQKVLESSDKLQDFGLNPPKATVTIVKKNNQTHNLKVGNQVLGGMGYYFMLDNNPAIYVLPNYKAEIFLRGLSYYRTAELFNFAVTDVTDLKVEKPDGSYLAFKATVAPKEKNHNIFSAFQMIHPYNAAAEGADVTTVINSFINMQILDFVEDNPSDLLKYGFKYTVSAAHGGTTDVIKVGNQYGEKIYIMINNDRTVYGVDKKLFSYIDLEPIKFLQSNLLLRNLNTVDTLNYSHGDINASFKIEMIEDEDHKITLNNKGMDQKEFKSLYTELMSFTLKGAVNEQISGETLLTLNFKYKKDQPEELKFIKLDDRRIAVSINGVAQFYTNNSDFTDALKKMDAIILKAAQ